MRDYSKVCPQFWIGETGRYFRGHKEAQVVAAYLMTNPHANMLGLYHLPITTLMHETGLTDKEVRKGLERAIEGGFCSYDNRSEVVFVHEMARFQIAEQLKPDDNRCKGVQNEYDSLIRNPFLPAFYEKYSTAFHMTRKRENASPSQGPTKPHRSQEQEQEQEQEGNHSVGLKPDLMPLAEDVLTYLNRSAGKGFELRNPAGGLTANAETILARLREGYTREQLREVVYLKCEQWSGDEKMAEYLRPETLFGRKKFQQYLGELKGAGDGLPEMRQ